MNREALVALTGGRVLSPLADGEFTVLSQVTVVLDGERIASVGPGAPPPGAVAIDVSGLTLLPGMVDLHTHVPTPSAMALYVQQGITGARFAGTTLGVVAALRERVASGEIPGPRIFSCGPLLDEPTAAWPDVSLEVSDRAAARAAAERVIDAEADALILAQRIRPDTLSAIVDVAHERGAPVTGQVWASSVREAVAGGMDGVENTARLPENPALEPGWIEGYRSIGHRLARLVWLWRTAPQEPIDEVVALMADRQTDWAHGAVLVRVLGRVDRRVAGGAARLLAAPRSGPGRDCRRARARPRAGAPRTATTRGPRSSGCSRRSRNTRAMAGGWAWGPTPTRAGCSTISSWICCARPV